jgi:hypothetical protein
MPPQESNAYTDPNIVEGPQKRCPPAQFAKNGDPPVARKKARHVPTSGGHKSVLTLTNQSLESSSDACSHSGTPKLANAETVLSESSDQDKNLRRKMTLLSSVCLVFCFL